MSHSIRAKGWNSIPIGGFFIVQHDPDDAVLLKISNSKWEVIKGHSSNVGLIFPASIFNSDVEIIPINAFLIHMNDPSHQGGIESFLSRAYPGKVAFHKITNKPKLLVVFDSPLPTSRIMNNSVNKSEFEDALLDVFNAQVE